MAKRLIVTAVGIAFVATGLVLAGMWSWQQLNLPLDLLNFTHVDVLCCQGVWGVFPAVWPR